MRAVRLPSWLVLALVLPACMRGCSTQGCGCESPAERCDDSSDCHRGTCVRGYCVDREWAQADVDCRAAPACKERGACSAVRKSSFLGLDPGLECAAITDQDCRQSQQCRTHGLCARVGLGDVGCGADSADLCKASVRCATHEECAVDAYACVRRWIGCPAVVLPDAPLWAMPVDLVWDYDTLRAPWHPGDVEQATIACRLTGHSTTDSTIRIAGQCTPGPHLDGGTATWLRAGITLHTGDVVAAAMQDGLVGPPSTSSFAQFKYQGDSPMFVGEDGETIECVVVPHELALERSRRELAAVDHGLADSTREHPNPDDPRALPGTLDSARVHAERAALWLGWSDPELAKRVKKLDEATASWQVRLEEAQRKAAAQNKAARPRDAAAGPGDAGADAHQ